MVGGLWVSFEIGVFLIYILIYWKIYWLEVFMFVIEMLKVMEVVVVVCVSLCDVNCVIDECILFEMLVLVENGCFVLGVVCILIVFYFESVKWLILEECLFVICFVELWLWCWNCVVIEVMLKVDWIVCYDFLIIDFLFFFECFVVWLEWLDVVCEVVIIFDDIMGGILVISGMCVLVYDVVVVLVVGVFVKEIFEDYLFLIEDRLELVVFYVEVNFFCGWLKLFIVRLFEGVCIFLDYCVLCR